MNKDSLERKILSVVIPVYYNENSLPALFEKLIEVEKSLNQLNINLQLIFVDDGSGDNSLAILKEFKQKRISHTSITIIKLTRNFGAVSASKTGFNYVTGDCFTILAADLQDSPYLLLSMIEKWVEGAKYVICVRKEREDPLTSRIFSYLYYKILHFFVIKNYPMTGFDFALMDKIFLPYLNKSGKHITIPFFPYWLGYKPEIIFYKRVARVHGKSRWTVRKKIKFFVDSIFGFSTAPLKFISVLGFFVSIISFIYGISIIISSLLGKVPVAGYATIISLLSFFSGLMIFMLAIIGEYVWRVFDEISHNPSTVIEDVF